jgi:hypothetical protein
MDRSWSARLNSLRVFWYRRIVNFDQQSQAETLNAVKEATGSSGKWLRDAIVGAVGRVKVWVKGPWDGARVARVGIAAGLAGSFIWFIASGRWRFASLGRGQKVDPIRREAGRWLRRVEGPEPLVAELQRLRYGPTPSWPKPSEVFRRARHAASNSPRRRSASSRSTS